MFGNLNAAEIENLLRQEITGRIGCHADDVTYVVPISYSYDGTYIYARTFEGMKLNMMRKNPSVCFQVDHMQNMANWQSVIAWGKFEELTEKQLRNNALKHLIDRHVPLIASKTVQLTAEWPFPAVDLEVIKGVVFRIKVEKKTGRFERNEESFGIY